MVRCAVALCLVFAVRSPAWADVVFPADSGVIVVTAYGATPDDGRDDTAAIQKALDEHPSGNHIFYFPNGQYLISKTLRPALDDGVTKRNIFQGQSRKGTVLKLCDGLDHKDAVIDYRGGPAQFFRNAVRNLTIDIGRGNPEATGLKFNASNQGTVRNVTIRSADGAGRTGLDLRHSGEVGPLLVKDLLVVGFDVGVWSGWQTASQAFEDVTLRHQRTFGWVNEASQSVFAHRVRSTGEVPAIWNARYKLPGDGQGKFLLVDAVLRGEGRASQVEAIRNGKAMYLRDVRARGYKRVLTNAQRGFRGNGSIHGDRIEEYWANGSAENRRGGPFQLFPSPNQSLRLAIEDAPAVPWESDPSRWGGPHQHGGTANDGEDDTAALQAAVDSGATTVYLPRGRWRIDGTVVLRGAVERLLGTEAHVAGRGTVRIGAGRSEVVAIEGDIEGRDGVEAKLVNDGGSVWILGFKTEDDGTHIITRNGGQTELLGALHVGAATERPQYITENARFAAAVANGGPGLVRETRDGTTRTGRIGHADLYAALTWCMPSEWRRFG